MLVAQPDVESRADVRAVERAREDAAEGREIGRARLDGEDAVLVVLLQVREEEQPIFADRAAEVEAPLPPREERVGVARVPAQRG